MRSEERMLSGNTHTHTHTHICIPAASTGLTEAERRKMARTVKYYILG